MPRKESISLYKGNLTEHAASRAWGQFCSRSIQPSRIEILKNKQNHAMGVYRLYGAGPDQDCVIAKRCPTETVQVEHTVYTEVLPQLPLPSVRYYGCLEEEGTNRSWLFMSDAGDQKYCSQNPEHRRAASRRLGVMHTSASHLSTSCDLPDQGAQHYYDHLHSAQVWLEKGVKNPAISEEYRETISSILRLFGELQQQWSDVVAFCNQMPTTLVHGDFVAKNVHITTLSEGGPQVLPFDWEVSGWGGPAADVGASEDVDLDSYYETVRDHWPSIDSKTILHLATVGGIFRCLAAINWVAPHLLTECPYRVCLHFQRYLARLRDEWAKFNGNFLGVIGPTS